MRVNLNIWYFLLTETLLQQTKQTAEVLSKALFDEKIDLNKIFHVNGKRCQEIFFSKQQQMPSKLGKQPEKLHRSQDCWEAAGSHVLSSLSLFVFDTIQNVTISRFHNHAQNVRARYQSEA